MAAARNSLRQASRDLIFSCGICLESLTDVYAGLDAKGDRKPDALPPLPENTIVKFYMMHCGHLVCHNHLPPVGRHASGRNQQVRKAACPVCRSQGTKQYSPVSFYDIVNPEKGFYDPIIPNEYFSLPSFDLQKPVPGMDADPMKFQYQTLVRNLRTAHKKISELKEDAGILRTNLESEQLYSDRVRERLHERTAEVEKLFTRARQVEDWQEKENAIRHYISIVQPLADENTALREQLRGLGREVPNTQYTLRVAHDGRLLQDLLETQSEGLRSDDGPSQQVEAQPTAKLQDEPAKAPPLTRGRAVTVSSSKQKSSGLQVTGREVQPAKEPTREERPRSRDLMPPPPVPNRHSPGRLNEDWLTDEAERRRRKYVVPALERARAERARRDGAASGSLRPKTYDRRPNGYKKELEQIHEYLELMAFSNDASPDMTFEDRLKRLSDLTQARVDGSPRQATPKTGRSPTPRPTTRQSDHDASRLSLPAPFSAAKSASVSREGLTEGAPNVRETQYGDRLSTHARTRPEPVRQDFLTDQEQDARERSTHRWERSATTVPQTPVGRATRHSRPMHQYQNDSNTTDRRRRPSASSPSIDEPVTSPFFKDRRASKRKASPVTSPIVRKRLLTLPPEIATPSVATAYHHDSRQKIKADLERLVGSRSPKHRPEPLRFVPRSGPSYDELQPPLPTRPYPTPDTATLPSPSFQSPNPRIFNPNHISQSDVLSSRHLPLPKIDPTKYKGQGSPPVSPGFEHFAPPSPSPMTGRGWPMGEHGGEEREREREKVPVKNWFLAGYLCTDEKMERLRKSFDPQGDGE